MNYHFLTAQEVNFAELFSKDGEAKKINLIYAKYNFKDYFDILPEIMNKSIGDPISVYLYDNILFQPYFDALPRERNWLDTILDQKFCKSPAICRSKELARNQFIRLLPYIERNLLRIYGFKSANESKEEILFSLTERIVQDTNSTYIVVLPIGFVSAQVNLKESLENRGYQVNRVLFAPLKVEEKEWHESMRRNEPITALDGISYKKLKRKTRDHFTLLPIIQNVQSFPETSTFYDYLLLVRNPEYLPNPNVQCCK